MAESDAPHHLEQGYENRDQNIEVRTRWNGGFVRVRDGNGVNMK